MFLRLLAAAAVMLAAACGTNPPPSESIEIDDRAAFQPVLRGSVSLGRQRGPASDPQSGHAVEFGGTRVKGESDQEVRPGGYTSIGGSNFLGPTTLTNEFELRQFEIAYRFRAIDRDNGVGIDLLAGPALYQLDVAVNGQGRRVSEDLTSVGLQLGLGTLWRIRQGTSVHLRGFYFYSADDAAVTRAARLEAYFSQALMRNLALRGGYAGWNLKSDRGGATSPINVEFRGPVLGLEVLF